MGRETDAGREERLENAAERLTVIYRSITELNREANRIRAHIRDFDVNVEALNMLANARSRDEKGGGAQVLQDLFEYARRMGARIDAGEAEVAPRKAGDEMQSSVEKSIQVAGETQPKDLLKLFWQLAVALALTWGLFVLIH